VDKIADVVGVDQHASHRRTRAQCRIVSGLRRADAAQVDQVLQSVRRAARSGHGGTFAVPAAQLGQRQWTGDAAATLA
jgi:hypothetical protein